MVCNDFNIGSITGRYKSNEPERNIVFESPLIKKYGVQLVGFRSER